MARQVPYRDVPRYAYRRGKDGGAVVRGEAAVLVVTVRCDACAGVFTDDLRALSPCPYCGQLARGAA